MPVPENVTVKNPTLDVDIRETRVRLTKSFQYAFGGIRVERFLADQVVDVTDRCAELIIAEGAGSIVDDKVEIFDPRVDRKPVAKTKK